MIWLYAASNKYSNALYLSSAEHSTAKGLDKRCGLDAPLLQKRDFLRHLTPSARLVVVGL